MFVCVLFGSDCIISYQNAESEALIGTALGRAAFAFSLTAGALEAIRDSVFAGRAVHRFASQLTAAGAVDVSYEPLWLEGRVAGIVTSGYVLARPAPEDAEMLRRALCALGEPGLTPTPLPRFSTRLPRIRPGARESARRAIRESLLRSLQQYDEPPLDDPGAETR